MRLTALDECSWALGFLASALLVAVLLERGRWKQFPVLATWIAFVTARTILLYVIFRSGDRGHLYAKVYWGGILPEFALQLGTVIECARSALRRRGKWVGDGKLLFVVAAVCAVVMSALLSAHIYPPPGGYSGWMLRMDLFVSLVICALIVSTTLIANWLRLAWERRSLAVAEGLTLFSAAGVVVSALQSYLGARHFKQIDYLQSYAWIAAMVWIAMEMRRPGTQIALPAPHGHVPSNLHFTDRADA